MSLKYPPGTKLRCIHNRYYISPEDEPFFKGNIVTVALSIHQSRYHFEECTRDVRWVEYYVEDPTNFVPIDLHITDWKEIIEGKRIG